MRFWRFWRFWELCDIGDIADVQAAINKGVDVNEEDEDGRTGLMRALSNSHNNVVLLLLNHPQIDINKVDEHGRCALHYAVFSEFVHEYDDGMAALLARQNLTTINQKDNHGWTPIMDAVEYNAVNCFNLLLAHPEVDLDTRDDYRRSPEEVHR